MSDQIVHDAYARVRSRYTDEAWFTLPPRAITDAIYREMRQIDAERLSGDPPPEASTPVSSAAA
jgi:hypothetical protein